ncbi:heterokaryon incompatibility protein-domain-containing protein [Pisolithus thermaeus]|nr:heterokaryon incompatibility protein-domain-containing protein [Pisolithus croceorrhizus]KAI6156443.1 heterokaryon incompatibility protein-domain-containing protein [Pisolithus thermaeus]
MRLIDVDIFLERERQMEEEGTIVRDTTTILKVLHDLDTDYAILSHRWKDEVDYLEITQLTKMENRDEIRKRGGYQKIVKSCQQAKIDGLEWIWVDTCCIDKRNSTELSEALNSMFRWYANSRRCYAYLHDIDVFPTTPDHETFSGSKGWPEWFSRGWTLQELIAPTDLQFFNKDWQLIGDKRNLACMLMEITRVPRGVLEDGLAAYGPSVAQVMSWAADRTTTRVEHRAYSLMGLVDVNMPMLYGEGKKAFLRLQQEIIRKSSDQTIFAWDPTDQTPQACCVLADDPSLFRDCHDIIQIDSKEFYSELSGLWNPPGNGANRGDTGPLQRRNHYFWRFLFPQQWTIQMQVFHPFTVTNMGIHVQLPARRYGGYPLILQVVLACKREGSLEPIVINLSPWRTRYYRFTGEVKCDLLPTSFQHSQIILAYEGQGASSGIVIEEVGGVVASLLDQCAAKSGMNVGYNNEHRFGVTSAEIHRVPGRWLQISPSVHPLSVPFSFFFTVLFLGLVARPGAILFFAAAMIILAIVWILSEASAGIPFIRLCKPECSSRGEYIIGSGMEIVVLRGRGRAVPSITHSETMMSFHVLQDVRIVVIILGAILFVSEGLFLEPSAAQRLLSLLPFLAILVLLSLLPFCQALSKALRSWSLIQVLYRLELRKYTFSTRITGIVFALLLLRTEKAAEVMNDLLPITDTKAWRRWKTIVLDRIRRGGDFNIDTTDWDDGTWTDREREMLVGLFQNAHDAYRVFERHLAESAFERPPA